MYIYICIYATTQNSTHFWLTFVTDYSTKVFYNTTLPRSKIRQINPFVFLRHGLGSIKVLSTNLVSKE